VRKKSKYKPKPVNCDNLTWILSGMRTIANLPVAGTRLLTRNHAALDEILHGRGDKDHVDVLISALNIAETLCFMGIGVDWLDELLEAQNALNSMATRGVSGKSFLFTGPEMQLVKVALAVHDEQLKVCTVKELEKALNIVEDFIRLGKAKKIKALETA
jgi:fructose-1,6-bisphosphatase/sedoheptulose 1,7-bisphosphatase-like protein